MSVRRNLVGLGLTLAVVGGVGAYGLEKAIENNNLPVTTTDIIPSHTNDQQQTRETLVCAANTPTCNTRTALGVTGVRGAVEPVPLDQISNAMKNTLVAVEDKDFYSQPGCQTKAIVRAAGNNILTKITHRGIQGGSGLDRQYVSLKYKDSSTYPPKWPKDILDRFQQEQPLAHFASGKYLDEAYECSLALKINQDYTNKFGSKEKAKDAIFAGELNLAPFGRGAIGIKAAANQYFGVLPKDLTIPQSAILTGVQVAPYSMDLPFKTNNTNDPSFVGTMYCPTHDKKKPISKVLCFEKQSATLIKNYGRVIDVLLAQKSITKKKAAEYINHFPTMKPYTPLSSSKNIYDMQNADNIGARPVVKTVLGQAAHQLSEQSGENITTTDVQNGGYTIITSIDTGDQKALYEAASNYPKLKGTNLEAATVSLRTDASVAAMVGSIQGPDAPNDATDARRPGGSSLKPYALAVEFADGAKATDKVKVPREVVLPKADNGKDWAVTSHDGCDGLGRQAPCTMTYQEATGTSSNTAFAQIVNEVGIKPIAETMRSLGMPVDPNKETSSLILGASAEGLSPLDQAIGLNNLITRRGEAIAYGNQSYLIISKILDSHGIAVYERPEATTKRVIDTEVARQVGLAMRSVISKPYGTAYGAVDAPGGRKSAIGKTGTAATRDGKRNTDLWGNLAACDGDPKNSRTIATWIGNPKGSIAITNSLSSYDPMAIGSRYLGSRYRAHTNKRCDITRK